MKIKQAFAMAMILTATACGEKDPFSPGVNSISTTESTGRIVSMTTSGQDIHIGFVLDAQNDGNLKIFFYLVNPKDSELLAASKEAMNRGSRVQVTSKLVPTGWNNVDVVVSVEKAPQLPQSAPSQAPSPKASLE